VDRRQLVVEIGPGRGDLGVGRGGGQLLEGRERLLLGVDVAGSQFREPGGRDAGRRGVGFVGHLGGAGLEVVVERGGRDLQAQGGACGDRGRDGQRQAGGGIRERSGVDRDQGAGGPGRNGAGGADGGQRRGGKGDLLARFRDRGEGLQQLPGGQPDADGI